MSSNAAGYDCLHVSESIDDLPCIIDVMSINAKPEPVY